ncbi:hypothetical protein TNCV_2281891 [Trichonephila clavipes]|nr:hypothetical protein TNCV_2281891 [Trichonephila clavipes]
MRRYVGRRNECLSSIKSMLSITTSGCFYPRSNHWEVGGGRSVTSVAAEFGIAHSSFHDFGTFKLQEQLSGSSVVVVEEPHHRMTALSYRPEETGGRQREKSLDTRHRRLDDRYRVLPWPEDLHGGGLFAQRRPVRCVPLTPAHREEARFSVCREHRNWRDNEWGRVLFTDERQISV